MRLIDRAIRPLFPYGFRNDVQVVATVMSVDQDCSPDVTAMIGASIALSISDIPFSGPIAGLIVGRINGEFVVNPTLEQAGQSEMHLVVAGTRDAVMMVEAGAREVPEEVMLEGIVFGHRVIQDIIKFQDEIIGQLGKPKLEIPIYQIDPELERLVRDYVSERVAAAVRNPDKLARQEAIDQLEREAGEHFLEAYPEQGKDVKEIFHSVLKETVRQMILEEQERPDGRKLNEIRPITCEAGILPRAHGSGLFTRGQTQALTVATLGAVSDEQILDGLGVEESKRYMHQYNFPPYSVGETRPMRGPGRREIGHGALAERALLYVLPKEEAFPYTIRLVSEILESNGSTSMASVCGSTLALMDAGVPISAPVAGIAMGLVTGDDKFAVLERHSGDRGRLGGYGLQGGRDRQGGHRPPDGHQGQGCIGGSPEKSAGAGKRGPDVHHVQDPGDTSRAAPGTLQVCAQDHHHHHRPGEDPGRYRARRQDHPEDHRRYRRPDRHRG